VPTSRFHQLLYRSLGAGQLQNFLLTLDLVGHVRVLSVDLRDAAEVEGGYRAIRLQVVGAAIRVDEP
jgi:hypothetical protein